MAESATCPFSRNGATNSQSAPAPSTSSNAASSKVPLHTITKFASPIDCAASAVLFRLRKEPINTVCACAHAFKARVPFVVVMVIFFP